MATYGLKYQSDFYNYFDKLVSIKIYKRDYSDSIETDLRVSQVIIKTNYQDDNTPVIGTGAKIVIIADSLSMSYLEDLLLSYERQFLCIIEYNSIIVFRGYSICDLNERQLLPYAEVTIQFTDYLHRLSEQYPICLNDISQNIDVLSLIGELMDLTTMEIPLYVNSTLFEETMNNTETDTFLPQVYVQNAQFYSNAYSYDNIYEAINKALHPFSAFLYYYKDNWIIERQEDITRSGNWVKYDETGESSAVTGVASVASLKSEYNKQNGDWQYVDCSQIIEYDSGLHTLIISLRDKLLDSLVFNNYTKDILTTNETLPDSGTLITKTWYAYTALTNIETGMVYEGLNTYIKFDSGNNIHGLYYNFNVQFNQDYEDESSGSGLSRQTILNVSYIMSSNMVLMDDNNPLVYKIRVRFLLRLDGGTYSDYWLQVGQSVGLGTVLYLYPSAPDGDYKSQDPGTWCFNSTLIDVTNGTYDWFMSKDFNLTNIPVVIYNVSGTGYDTYSSLWDALGTPKFQAFTIMFLPSWYTDEEKNNYPTSLVITNYLGDIAVTITAEDIDNKIEYHLNENFVDTDEIELFLFDLDNINYSNGLLGPDKTTLTKLWSSENSATPIPLYEIFAKCKFRKYGRTIHRLKGTILTDNILKVFSILTDDNVVNSSSETITFLLNSFTWDLNKGQYDIEAEEYTEEEIIVDGVTYDAEGNQQIFVPNAPTGLTLNIIPIFGRPVLVTWDPVGGGLIGYKLQRKPYYLSGAWVDAYKLLISGSLISYTDNVRTEAPAIDDDVTLTYRICAYNSAGDSEWSSEVQIVWNYSLF